ncbi:MAG: anti-sigma factor antagonist [Solirubrobacteraceae bacterium]|jgi:anti-anti-sigma factor|nr:anti-sigma factor antagonist [Solirubrobacteraceae bacterium]
MTHETPEQPEPSSPAQPLEFGELELTSGREGDVHTIVIAGELDVATAGRVERRLIEAEASDAAAIVLDLSGLTFMDSTGVRLVLSAHARSRADSNRLRLIRGPAAVHRVFELSGVDDTLPFDD